jgi:hypothetical protein
METIKKELSNQTTISYFELGVFEGMVTKKMFLMIVIR